MLLDGFSTAKNTLSYTKTLSGGDAGGHSEGINLESAGGHDWSGLGGHGGDLGGLSGYGGGAEGGHDLGGGYDLSGGGNSIGGHDLGGLGSYGGGDDGGHKGYD